MNVLAAEYDIVIPHLPGWAIAGMVILLIICTAAAAFIVWRSTWRKDAPPLRRDERPGGDL